MAMQHLFAFSGSVQGAGIAAGSPFGCGAFKRGHLKHGAKCYYGGSNISQIIQYARQLFKKGLIDDPSNLWSTPVVVFNGKLDWEVYTGVSRDIVKQLKEFVQPSKLESNLGTKASHVWSLDHGKCKCGACSVWGSGLCCDVNNCGYDLTGDILRRSYGSLKPRAEATQAYSWIRQDQYMPEKSSSWSQARLEKWAAVYVPTGCQKNTAACRVHINYHGCIANTWKKRRLWINNLDLNEYGEANNIIVLYPQAQGDHLVGEGCWNWGFAEDDRLYDTRESVQLRTVVNIVAHLEEALAQGIELPKDVGPPHQEEDEPETHAFLV